MLFAAVMSAIFLSGCSKELKTLSGTVWERQEPDAVITLTFTKLQAEMRYVSKTDSSDYSSVYFSYEYDSSVVMMYPEYDEIATIQGIISGNTMSVVNMSNNKTIGIFTKK